MLMDYGYGGGAPAWTWIWEPPAEPGAPYRWNDPLYSTPGHNVVMIGARNQELKGTGTIAKYQADDKLGVVTVLDCTNAYAGVKKATRTIIHLRPDILVVLDAFDLEQPEPAWLSWHVPAVTLPEGVAPDVDISAHLTPVHDGHFVIPGEKGRTLAFLTSLNDGKPTWSSDAHRRIGLFDHDGPRIPNTLFPYVRVRQAAADRHVFLSAFAFLPSDTPAEARWRREAAGLRLTIGAREIIVLAKPNASLGGISSDAPLVVADTASHHTVCAGGSYQKVGREIIKYSGGMHLAEW